MKKAATIVLIVLAALIVPGIVGGIVVKRLIEKELAALDLGETDVSSGSVRVNLLRRTISLRDVRLLTDIERRDTDTTRRSPIRYIDASIGRLTVRGIGLRGIRQGVFSVNSLIVDALRGTVVTRPVPADTTKKESNFHLQSIDIQSINLSDAALDWHRIATDHADTLIYKVSGLALSSQEVAWAAGSVPTVENLQGTASGVQYTMAKGDYILAINGLAWDSSAAHFSADSVELLPQHPKNRFMQRSATHSDYNEAVIAGVTAYGIDFQTLITDKTLCMDSLDIASGHFLSYKNRQLNYGQKVKPMLHAMIQKIPIPFEISTLSIHHFDAAYEELAVHGNAPGRVTFDDIEAVIHGMTNRATREDQYVEVYANAKLMTQSELRATISLPVDPANDHFEAKAVLHAMPFASLNPMIEPLAQVALQAGQIDRMEFAMSGNSTVANADMTLRYSGLEIAVMRERNGRWLERHGLSNLVNWAVVRRDNPDGHGLRTASESVRRDPYRSAFNYLWKGISAGAMETAESGAPK